MNHLTRIYLLFFFAGALAVLIPTLVFIYAIKPAPFQYSPNARAERRPYYIHILKTQKEVDDLRKTGIYLSDEATVGAAVRVSARGLGISLKRELDLPMHHVNAISPTVEQTRTVDGYTFTPNAIDHVAPSDIQILENDTQVQAAKTDPEMTYKDHIELGGGVVCLKKIPCYAIPRSTLKTMLTVEPFKPSVIQG